MQKNGQNVVVALLEVLIAGVSGVQEAVRHGQGWASRPWRHINH
jgi:hypothetical protein